MAFSVVGDEATRWLSWYGVGLASADRLPVVVRISAGPLGSLKCDQPKGNGRPTKKKILSGGRRGACSDDREDCYGRATVALTRAIQHTYIVSPLDMAGMTGMAQTLGVALTGIIPLSWTDTVSWTCACPIRHSSSLGLGT